MLGFSAFLAKELTEIARTWRIWVLPGIVLFFALTGPVLARFTPELLQALGPGEAGVVIELPEPTFVQAYQQWIQNLTQIVTLTIVIMLGGVVAGERRSGTAVFVLTKPLSRTSFILAKFCSQALLVLLTVSAGAAITWGVTVAMFGEAPLLPLAEATGTWLVWSLMFVGLMVLVSSLVGSQAGAAGLGLALFVLISIPTAWEAANRYSPAGLLTAPGSLVLDRPVALLWPLVTALVSTALAVTTAVWVFGRKEL